MTQEEIKEQFTEYAKNNMNNLMILEGIKELLDSISNDLYYDGFISTSNNLVTASLIINEIIKED